jgi:hypothetical protein
MHPTRSATHPGPQVDLVYRVFKGDKKTSFERIGNPHELRPQLSVKIKSFFALSA